MKTQRKKSTGLQRRWLRRNVSVLAVLVFVLVFLLTLSMSVYYYSSITSDLRVKAVTTTGFFSDYIGMDYSNFVQSCAKFASTFNESDKLELQFISTDCKLVATSLGSWTGQSIQTRDVQQALSTGKISVFNGADPLTQEHVMAVSSPMVYTNGEVIGILRYVTSLREVNRQILLVGTGAALCGIVFVLVILLNGVYFIRSIIKPVTEITAVAKHIEAGSYGTQIQRKFNDEIGELADTINAMSIKISQSERLQSEFISSVSHELRTPLTAISGWGETLLSGDGLEGEDTRRGVQIILGESRRLTGMVEDLLEFTRMQDGRFSLNVQVCDIRTVFEDTVFMYGRQLRQEGIDLEYLENDDDIPEISCDPHRLRQVFLNILDNAAKHGGEGKKITASMTLENDNVVVRIRDFGPGIPEEELPHIKLKFYKGSSKARGSGIGLAVCDEIVSMHGGTLTLQNAPEGGTLVTITLACDSE